MTTTPLAAGRWIKQRRKELGLTQEALAERAGCSWETLRKIEAGIVRPSQQLAELLVVHLDVPPAERADAVRLLRAIPLTPKTATAPPAPAAVRHPRALPVPPTSLIGRAQEVARLRALLRQVEVRLITLVGPPGIGKTRLALATTATLRDEFADGVAFVELAPLTDPALITPAIAGVLGVPEVRGRSLLDSLIAHLREPQVLLVLDNCEHLMEAAGIVDTLLRAAPGLKVLATSRTPLGLYGEKEFPVPALGLPESRTTVSPVELARADAVHLFVERARDIQPDFTLTPENAGAVAAICARLDGLPLAIELAAARIRLLPPAALVERLGQRLAVLTRGARNLPPRQQTLRGAIAWSYDLLSAEEQQLFRRLAVFQGSATLAALAAVCNAAGDLRVDVLDGVESLVRKSLMQARAGRHGEPRFGMLETIQEYAREQLAASGEEPALRLAHARYFLQLAEETDVLLAGAQQKSWLNTMEDEYHNSRAALEWLLDDAPDAHGAKLELGLRLAGALGWFWAIRRHSSEGRGWLATALDQYQQRVDATPAGAVPAALEGALYATLVSAGLFAWGNGNLDAAQGFFQRSLDIGRRFDDSHRICSSLIGLGNVLRDKGDITRGTACTEECLTVGQAAGDKWAIDQALNNLGCMALEQGDYAAARAMLDESLRGRRASEAKIQVAQSLSNLGIVAYCQEDYPAARAFLEESLALSLEMGDIPAVAANLSTMAAVEVQSAGLTRTQRDHAQDLGAANNGDRADRAAAYRAGVLLGATDGILGTKGGALERMERRVYDRAREVATGVLGDEAFAAGWREGQAMTMEQAVAYACAAPGSGS